MAVKLGVHVYEKATAVKAAAEAQVGIAYIVGTAPAHMAEKGAKPNTPVLCTSWDEAVEKLGYSEDWESYTLCQAMYAMFQLFAVQPVVFCNVLDGASMKEAVAAEDFNVEDHAVILPGNVLDDAGLVVKTAPADPADAVTLAKGTDYSVLYEDGTCVVELLETGSAYAEVKLNIGWNKLNPGAVTAADIAEGVAQVDACLTAVGVVPDLILAPGWSGNPTIAALMATKAGAINGVYRGKAIIDVDCTEDGVTEYSQLSGYKALKNLVDENQILCWPKVKLGERVFNLSVQLAALMAQVDAGNRGKPYESPSNKNLKIDGCVLADGTEVMLTLNQIDLVCGAWGVVTAMCSPRRGWVARGNYTACWPGNTDLKDYFIPVSRMFDYLGNTIINTYEQDIDKPLTPALKNSLLQTCNGWLDALTGGGYLYGGRAELLAEENPTLDKLNGKLTLHVFNASPVPLQSLDAILEYDVAYMEAALS